MRPYKPAFRKGISNIPAVPGKNQNGHVIYTQYQNKVVQNDSGALKKMNAAVPQNMGTRNPITAAILIRRFSNDLLPFAV
jgi:hypothetical protein